jgi:indolepyruvate ferredoxin oxidoreductase beta subunit
LESCEAASKRFIGEDFAKIAEESGTVISASLFGALASSGALPWSKEEFIAAVERSGVGVSASLKAFERSFEITKAPNKSKSTPVSIEIGKKPEEPRPAGLSPQEELALISDPASGVGPALREVATRIKTDFPEPVRVMLVHGIKRCAEYQDVKYATQYLDRLARIKVRDEKLGDGRFQLLTEVARYTALWMTYEDTIRVADLKARRRRFDRVKKEAKANDSQITQVREYFHPGVEEITDTLPGPIGRAILRSQIASKIIERVTKDGLRLHTTSLHGYLLLYTLSRLRPLRRRSLRFSLEQDRIDTWLDQVFETASEDYGLAVEIAETANVIKGYGDTHRNGLNNFNAIMREVNQLRAKKDSNAAAQIAKLRQAALADENGAKLRTLLSTSA